MQKIKIFGLGGFGEYGKNMYCILVDNKYFILDAGIKYPTSELYGIDEVIADFSVLKRVKNQVCGIFISHAHEDNCGALVHILKELEVDIYATELAIEVIKDDLQDSHVNFKKESLKVIDENTVLDFDGVKVSFFNTSHSIPESLAINIHTDQGVILYTSEFSFDEGSNPLYQTNYRKLNKIANEGVLALLIESYGSRRLVQSGSDVLFHHEIENVFKDTPKGRIIFSLFANDLLKIQKIIDESIKNKRKIAILGRKAQRLVDIAIQNGYLHIPFENFKKLFFINDEIKNKDDDLVILVTGTRHEPFYMLQRMAKKQDKLIHIDNEDTVVILTPPVPGTESIAASTLDQISRVDAKIIEVKQDLLITSNATANEIKMMINLTKPKFVIPVIGEFQHQATVIKIAKSLGYSTGNCYLFENGDMLSIEEGKATMEKGVIPTGDILIDGTPIYDKNDVVIKDRELLAIDGIIIISACISKDNRKAGDIIIKTNGFFNPPEHDKYMKEVEKTFKTLFDDMLKKPRRLWGDMKRKIRSQMSVYINNSSNRNPVVILMISDSSN